MKQSTKLNEDFDALKVEYQSLNKQINLVFSFFYFTNDLIAIGNKKEILKINEKKWIEQLGISEKDIIKEGWQFFIHPEDLNFLNEYVNQIQNGKLFFNRYMSQISNQYEWILWSLENVDSGLFIASGKLIKDPYEFNKDVQQIMYTNTSNELRDCGV